MSAFKDPEVMAALQDGTCFCSDTLCHLPITCFFLVYLAYLIIELSFYQVKAAIVIG